MEGVCTLVKPAGGTGERVAIGRCTLPFSLHQLDAPSPEDINSRKDFHKDQRIIRWMAMTRISFAPARFSALISDIHPLLVHHRMDGNEALGSRQRP